MRIAWTGPLGPGGGVPGMGLLMLHELVRRGVEVDVYHACDSTVDELPVNPQPGLRVFTRRSGWRWDRWYSRTKPTAFVTSMAARSLNATLLSVRLLIEHRRRPYDAVFQLSQTELFLLGRARRWAPPIVVHPCSHAAGELRWHRAEQEYALRSERRVAHFAMRAMILLRARLQPAELSRADLVIGPSRRFNQLVHEDYGVPQSKQRVLRHPVDLERFAPNGSHPPQGPLTVLFVSRISARKGVEDVIELSHRLADLSGSVRLLVVGGVTMWSDYSAHLADLHPDVAEYVGSVPGSEMPTLLRSAAMMLVPSRYEPGSIATGEALACGLPVVLSDEVGPSEIVSGPHVRVYRAGDVDALEAAVRSLLDEVGADRARLAATARANAEEQFAPRHVMAELIEMLGAAAAPR
ncbi:MAG TPA: glycosyltransferase family 4 protein [Solirubrobacter sp.]